MTTNKTEAAFFLRSAMIDHLRARHNENLRQTGEKHTAEMRRAEASGAQDLRSRERRAELDEKIAKKRALGTKAGAAKKKAKRKE